MLALPSAGQPVGVLIAICDACKPSTAASSPLITVCGNSGPTRSGSRRATEYVGAFGEPAAFHAIPSQRARLETGKLPAYENSPLTKSEFGSGPVPSGSKASRWLMVPGVAP